MTDLDRDGLRAAEAIDADLTRLTWAQTHRVETDDLTDEAVLRLALDVPRFRVALDAAVARAERAEGEAQRLQDALTNTRAVSADRLADRDRIARDLMAERDAAVARAERAEGLVERYRVDAQAVAMIRRDGGAVEIDGVRIVAASRPSPDTTCGHRRHEWWSYAANPADRTRYGLPVGGDWEPCPSSPDTTEATG